MILEEFDCNKNAVINPWEINERREDFPKVAVSCFAKSTFNRLVKELNAVEIGATCLANMDILIYKAFFQGVEVALFMSYPGAAGCVSVLEDLFAMGIEKIVLFGTCGVLDKDIEDCSIIIPNRAVRDEGTSFHYAPSSDEIAINEKYKEEFFEILEQHNCTYVEGKVWTTDGIYRETRDKVSRRKEMGCICVDMECSAVAALAKFREKEIFQFFYAADNLDSEQWDSRSLANDLKLIEKDRVALLAMELAVKMV